MPYFLYLCKSRPPLLPSPLTLAGKSRLAFNTEAEAVGRAGDLLHLRQYFVAAIERPDGTYLTPAQVEARCNPLREMLRKRAASNGS